MGWTIQYTEGALEDLDALSRADARTVVRAIDHFAESGKGNVESIEGHKGLFRLRAGGEWRVLFRYEAGRVFVVKAVRDRKGAYRRLTGL